jgi:putative addiction module component (TIGR02574 family)
MTKAELKQKVLGLLAQDRRELVEVLWESLEQQPVALPTWQRDLLEERLAMLEAAPEEGTLWAELEKRIWRGSE